MKHKLAVEKDCTQKKLKRAEQVEKIESNPNQFKEKLEQESSSTGKELRKVVLRRRKRVHHK